MKNTEQLAAMIAAGEVTEHHTASRRGYISRRSAGKVEAYSGKFGKGFILVTPRFDTTQYVYITYYINQED